MVSEKEGGVGRGVDPARKAACLYPLDPVPGVAPPLFGNRRIGLYHSTASL